MNRLVAVILLAGTCLAGAQTPRPLPAPPFLREIPPGTRWVMSAETSPSAQGSPAQPAGADAPQGTVLRRESVKSDKLRQDIFLVAPRIRDERWMASGYLLIGDGTPDNIIVLSDGTGGSASNWLSALDFRELRWVGPSTLKGWTRFEGRELLLFEGEVPTEAGGLAAIFRSSGGAASANGPVPTQTVRAWIDAETRFPVAYDDGTRLYHYTFAPNAQVPVLPDSYRTRIDAYIRRSRSMY